MLTYLSSKIKYIIGVLILSFSTSFLFAQNATTNSTNNTNYLEILLIITAIVFVFVIWVLAQVLLTLSKSIMKKRKGDIIIKSTMLILLTSVLSSVAQSQPAELATGLSDKNNFGGMATLDFYALATVIGLELMVILFLSFMVRRAFRELSGKADEALASVKKTTSLAQIWSNLDKKWMTRAVPVEQEADILLDHDYDGIRELDNALPPWWKYGFYITIVAAVIYLLNFHVWGIGKNPEEEYAAEMEEGKRIEELYMAKTKNLVDESNVMIADAGGIEAGKTLYIQACVACHGTKGEGGIGPNLTDEYWIHGGSMNNIYKTIKVGYPEKGMQSWQSMYSPVQIKNLSSFVKKLKGTNPPNGKSPQGIEYKEQESLKSDSANVNPTLNSKQ